MTDRRPEIPQTPEERAANRKKADEFAEELLPKGGTKGGEKRDGQDVAKPGEAIEKLIPS